MAQDPHLHGLIDMGSNGIRFSITTLSPHRARTLPQLHHHRAPISLHDAQFSHNSAERRPLPQSTIDAVTSAVRSFKRTCTARGVPAANIRVLATEATRTAPNASELIDALKEKAGVADVALLPKEEEARLGALGIAASVPRARGVTLDLGGGSVQVGWVRAPSAGGAMPQVSERVESLPFGAAAVMKRFEGGNVKGLEEEVRGEMARVVKGLDVPDELRGRNGSVDVYASGGGFRGWGYLLMASEHGQGYPIQMISGYSVSGARFADLESVDNFVAESKEKVNATAGSSKKKKKKSGNDDDEDADIHRISARRLYQLPAIKMVVSAFAWALKKADLSIGRVTFCAGGVPVGLLYSMLTEESRAQDALAVAARESVPPGALDDAGAEHAATLFDTFSSSETAPAILRSMCKPLALLIDLHSPLPKDIRAAAALRFPITGSVAMGGALGIDHPQRAALALALCWRWGGDSELPSIEREYYRSLQATLGVAGSWWTMVLGKLANLIADLSAGDEARVADIKATVSQDAKARDTLKLRIGVEGADAALIQDLAAGGTESDEEAGEADEPEYSSSLRKKVKSLTKAGKKKNWISVGGSGGYPQVYGMRVDVDVQAAPLA